MASKTADAIKLVLRLPKPLHKRLTQQARRENVSLNTLIVNQLSNPRDLRIAPILQKEIETLVGDSIQAARAEIVAEIETLVSNSIHAAQAEIVAEIETPVRDHGVAQA